METKQSIDSKQIEIANLFSTDQYCTEVEATLVACLFDFHDSQITDIVCVYVCACVGLAFFCCLIQTFKEAAQNML